jgi:hypothetical protein
MHNQSACLQLLFYRLFFVSATMSPSMDKNDIQHVDDKADSVQESKPHQIVRIDDFQVLGLDPDDAEFYINYPEEKKKRVIHKVKLPLLSESLHRVNNFQVDIRLVPMLAVLYLISHIDRANIGVSIRLCIPLAFSSSRPERKD